MTDIKAFKSKRKDPTSVKKSRKLWIQVVSTSIVFILILTLFITLTLQAYEVRSPIILRNPFVLKVNSPKPSNPVKLAPKKAVAVPQPTVVPEARITPFKKYITADANEVRNMLLPIIQSEYDADNAVAFDNIIKKESGYRPDAVNEIGAGGLCQALPASKMGCPVDSTKDAAMCQFRWCSKYLEERYGSPVQGYQFHLANNWF